MAHYFWDIGFDLNSSAGNLECGLVEQYSLPPGSGNLAQSVSTTFHLGDQVSFNIFNVTSPTMSVTELSGQVVFTKEGGSPFGGDVMIPLSFIVSGDPGQSALFKNQPDYPHWLTQSYLVTTLGIFKFRVSLTVTTVSGIKRFQSQDPEMIGGAT